MKRLAGVLLPSATVFLVLLCNDKAVLGPWVNTMRQNIMAGVIVWALVLLSLALTAATFFPNLTAGQLEWGFGAGVAVGVLGGAAIAGATLRSRRTHRKLAAAQVAVQLGGLDPEQVEDLDDEPDDRKVRKALRNQARDTFRTPALDTLARPAWSPLRTAGMVALRGYLLVAVVLVGVKVAEAIGG